MDDPELLECPYDKSHMITPLRMPYHLLKCRKNFPTMDLAVCPFNATHEVHKAELRYHMMNCPSRAVLEKEIAYESMMRATNGVGGQTVNKGCTDLPPYRKLEIHDDQQEDWDAERNFNTFTAFPSRDRQQQRRINEREEVTLRRPVTEGKAARLAMAAEPNSDIPQPAFNPSLLSLGRGRSRPSCPAEVKPGAATPAFKPNIPSGLPPRPGLYSLAPTNVGNKSVPSLARGRGLLPPSTT